MKIIIGIFIWVLFVFVVSSFRISMNTTQADNYIDENIDGSVQVFDYMNVRCLTWQMGYGGGMSCLPKDNYTPL